MQITQREKLVTCRTQVLLEHSPVPPLSSLSHAEGCQSLFVDLPQAPAFFQVPWNFVNFHFTQEHSEASQVTNLDYSTGLEKPVVQGK